MDEVPETPGGSGLDRLSRGAWARLLDLRTYICALFAIFGVVLVVLGFLADDADLAKADGININLWTGLAMLLVAGAFGLWLASAPPEVPASHEPDDE